MKVIYKKNLGSRVTVIDFCWILMECLRDLEVCGCLYERKIQFLFQTHKHSNNNAIGV